jgi:hypothetical protein
MPNSTAPHGDRQPGSAHMPVTKPAVPTGPETALAYPTLPAVIGDVAGQPIRNEEAGLTGAHLG